MGMVSDNREEGREAALFLATGACYSKVILLYLYAGRGTKMSAAGLKIGRGLTQSLHSLMGRLVPQWSFPRRRGYRLNLPVARCGLGIPSIDFLYIHSIKSIQIYFMRNEIKCAI